MSGAFLILLALLVAGFWDAVGERFAESNGPGSSVCLQVKRQLQCSQCVGRVVCVVCTLAII